MKNSLCVLVLILCFGSSFGQTKFNPDSTSTSSSPSSSSSSSIIKNDKPNFKEFSGFSYEILAGFFIPSSIPLVYYSFGFYPRYNILAPKDWISLSVGSPTNAGFDFAAGSGGSLIRYMLDIPLTLDVNLGARATKDNTSIFGAFLGAGLNYNFMHVTFNNYKADVNTFGPVIHGGLRWMMNGRPSGIRISYLTGLSFDGLPSNRVFAFSFVYGI